MFLLRFTLYSSNFIFSIKPCIFNKIRMCAKFKGNRLGTGWSKLNYNPDRDFALEIKINIILKLFDCA